MKNTYNVWIGIPAKWAKPDGYEDAIIVVPANDEIIGYEFTGYAETTLEKAIKRANRFYSNNIIITESATNKTVWKKS